MPGHNRDDRTLTVALTLRPRSGLRPHHEARLHRFLDDCAEQWEIFEEHTDEDDETTRHLHGRILLKDERRMDKIKEKMIIYLGLVTAERDCVLGGIKWLYDDWDYAGKDGRVWDRHITDEGRWVYADPKNKYVKKKNAQVEHYLAKWTDLPTDREVTKQEILDRLHIRWFVLNAEDAPKTEASRKELAGTIALAWNTRTKYGHLMEESDSPGDDF